MSVIKTGYERVTGGAFYYVEEADGSVRGIFDGGEPMDDEAYNCGKYHSSEKLALNNSRADTLMRNLRRYAVEHNESEIEWLDNAQKKWFIYFDYKTQSLCADYSFDVRYFGEIYFETEEMAYIVAELFEDELTWYFTEYEDRVSEDRFAGREGILKRAIATYGIEPQKNVAIEEMAELTKELIKSIRYKDDDNAENIAEEIADVEIMLEQIKMIYQNSDVVEKQKNEKIKRLEKRLNDADCE